MCSQMRLFGGGLRLVETEGLVQGAHGKLHVFVLDDHRGLDFAGADHLDVDASSARVRNIVAAMPTCERTPMPTLESLPTLGSAKTSLAPTAGATWLCRTEKARSSSVRCTVKEKSVVPATGWSCTMT